MTLPRGFLGGVRGDGLADERRGADAARSAAGSGSKTIDDRGGGAVAEARASSGVPAVEGVPDHGSGGPDLEATRSPRQPAQAEVRTLIMAQFPLARHAPPSVELSP